MRLDQDYYLLLGDLHGSTRLAPAQSDAAMTTLKQELAHWSAVGRSDLVLPLQVNYGDEFAGLFRTPRLIHDVVAGLRAALHGQVGFRFVAAKGRIGHVSDRLSEVNGEIFKRASEALSRMKSKGRFARWLIASEAENVVLDALSEAAHALRSDLTDYQREVLQHLSMGLSQADIAQALDKLPQSVSDAVRRGHLNVVLELDALIRARLQALAGGATAQMTPVDRR